MVIYANTHHNSDEEFQLTPMEGSWTSQGFYGTEITLLHLRGCGFPYKLAMERPSVAISPQTTWIRTIMGCLLNAVSSGSSIDSSNHEPLDWGLRIFILINISAPPPQVIFMHNELAHLSDPGLRGSYHLHLGYVHDCSLSYYVSWPSHPTFFSLRFYIYNIRSEPNYCWSVSSDDI